MGNSNTIGQIATEFIDIAYIDSSEELIKSSKTPFIFSPDNWTVLQPELETKNWSDLNIGSNLNMFVQFEILITSYYGGWRNIFHFSDGGNSDSRLPSMWVAPDGSYLSYCNSTYDDYYAWLPTPTIPFNTPTKITIAIFGNDVKMYINSVLQSTQTFSGVLLEASSGNTILYISDPWYPTDGGVQIKNLTFGNLSQNIKCSKDKICVGFEPDNRAYCYGSDGGCVWGGGQCTTDDQCRTAYNMFTSPKYNGGGDDYCAQPLYSQLKTSTWENGSDWPSGACPDVYNRANSESCNYQMSSTELQCYRNNNPDLKKLTNTQLQENWSTSGCIEQRNNQCPSYQTTSGTYSFIGCYNDMCYNGEDNDPRALPNYRGLVNSIDECEQIAESNRETLFGVQDSTGIGNGQAQCFTGNVIQSATQYGLNVNRNKCAPMGGWCTNQVYKRDTPFPPPPPPIPVLKQANFSSNIENFENNSKAKKTKILFIIEFIILFIVFFLIIYYFKLYQLFLNKITK